MTAIGGPLIVGLPLAALTALAAWVGLRWFVALPLAFALPGVICAVWFIVTNEDAEVSDQFDEPGLVGMMVGSVIATLSAPVWGAAFYAGHRLRRG